MNSFEKQAFPQESPKNKGGKNIHGKEAASGGKKAKKAVAMGLATALGANVTNQAVAHEKYVPPATSDKNVVYHENERATMSGFSKSVHEALQNREEGNDIVIKVGAGDASKETVEVAEKPEPKAEGYYNDVSEEEANKTTKSGEWAISSLETLVNTIGDPPYSTKKADKFQTIFEEFLKEYEADKKEHWRERTKPDVERIVETAEKMKETLVSFIEGNFFWKVEPGWRMRAINNIIISNTYDLKHGYYSQHFE